MGAVIPSTSLCYSALGSAAAAVVELNERAALPRSWHRKDSVSQLHRKEEFFCLRPFDQSFKNRNTIGRCLFGLSVQQWLWKWSVASACSHLLIWRRIFKDIQEQTHSMGMPQNRFMDFGSIQSHQLQLEVVQHWLVMACWRSYSTPRRQKEYKCIPTN